MLIAAQHFWQSSLSAGSVVTIAQVFARLLIHSGIVPTPSLTHSSSLKWQQFCAIKWYASEGHCDCIEVITSRNPETVSLVLPI